MEKFKLEIFKKDNAFDLPYITLNKDDSIWIVDQISLTLRDSYVKNENSFFHFLNDSLEVVFLYNNNFSSSFLKELIIRLQLTEESLVFVVWDLDLPVDLFKLENLVDYWNYIWYDASDEAIALFFPSKNKVLLLTDHGYLKYNK